MALLINTIHQLVNTQKIDLLNIYLIVASLIIALVLPFKLFLFSYAILGPLHYLTEIVWLNEKKFFTPANRNWAVTFVLLTILISIYPVAKFINLGVSESIQNVIQSIENHRNVLILISFLFAGGLLSFKKRSYLTLTLFLAISISYLSFTFFPKALLFIGIFLPTLIHVYVFTLLFILYGALKAKSNTGIYLAILLFFVPFIISYIPIDFISHNSSSETMDAFVKSNMAVVSSAVASILNKLQSGNLLSTFELGLRIQVFIAFAYTYHYLNWFSKTSVIGWRKAMSKSTTILILVLWISSVGLYLYDFQTGFIALFFLSFLHVLLEFPLNIFTIKELAFSIKNKIS